MGSFLVCLHVFLFNGGNLICIVLYTQPSKPGIYYLLLFKRRHSVNIYRMYIMQNLITVEWELESQGSNPVMQK